MTGTYNNCLRTAESLNKETIYTGIVDTRTECISRKQSREVIGGSIGKMCTNEMIENAH